MFSIDRHLILTDVFRRGGPRIKLGDKVVAKGTEEIQYSGIQQGTEGIVYQIGEPEILGQFVIFVRWHTQGNVRTHGLVTLDDVQVVD